LNNALLAFNAEKLSQLILPLYSPVFRTQLHVNVKEMIYENRINHQEFIERI